MQLQRNILNFTVGTYTGQIPGKLYGRYVKLPPFWAIGECCSMMYLLLFRKSKSWQIGGRGATLFLKGIDYGFGFATATTAATATATATAFCFTATATATAPPYN
jgi:hypothetical protein